MFQFPWTKLANENEKLRLEISLYEIGLKREWATIQRLQRELHELQGRYDRALKHNQEPRTK